MSGTTVTSNRNTLNPAYSNGAQGPQNALAVPVADQDFGYSADSGWEASSSGEVAGVEYDASVSGPKVNLSGNASANVGPGGIDINVNVDVNATLAQAGANGTHTFQVEVGGETLDVTVDLSADGMVGADGQLNLNIHIGTDGKVSINAGASGFAGARASLTGGVTVSHDGNEVASGSVTLSATAGVGAQAHANVEISGGKISFDVGAEATTVGGFGVEVDGDIDARNTANLLAKVLGGLAEDGVEWAGDALGDVGEWVGDRFEDIGGWISDRIPDLDWPW